MLKTKPEGAKLFVIKEKFLFLKTKTPKERMEITENAQNCFPGIPWALLGTPG